MPRTLSVSSLTFLFMYMYNAENFVNVQLGVCFDVQCRGLCPLAARKKFMYNAENVASIQLGNILLMYNVKTLSVCKWVKFVSVFAQCRELC